MITNVNRIYYLVTKKKFMFDDQDSMNKYDNQSDKVIFITEEAIIMHFDMWSKIRLCWRISSRRSFKYLKKLKGSEFSLYNDVCRGVDTIQAEMLEKESFATDVIVSILIFLNKNASELCNFENIRLIAIANIMLKLLEDVYIHLQVRSTIRKANTQEFRTIIRWVSSRLLALTLIQLSLELKCWSYWRNTRGAVSILFVNFKAAYFYFKHDLLFKKIEKRTELLNIIKVIYSFEKPKRDVLFRISSWIDVIYRIFDITSVVQY